MARLFSVTGSPELLGSGAKLAQLIDDVDASRITHAMLDKGNHGLGYPRVRESEVGVKLVEGVIGAAWWKWPTPPRCVCVFKLAHISDTRM